MHHSCLEERKGYPQSKKKIYIYEFIFECLNWNKPGSDPFNWLIKFIRCTLIKWQDNLVSQYSQNKTMVSEVRPISWREDLHWNRFWKSNFVICEMLENECFKAYQIDKQCFYCSCLLYLSCGEAVTAPYKLIISQKPIKNKKNTQSLTDFKQGFHLHGHEWHFTAMLLKQCHHYTFIVHDGLYNDREGQKNPSTRLM